MKIFLFSVLIAFTFALPEPFDVIEDSIKLINFTTSPCTDFYRHACPLGSPPDLMNNAFTELFHELDKNERWPLESFRIWSAIEIQSTLMHSFAEPSDFAMDIFNAVCPLNNQKIPTYIVEIMTQLGFPFELFYYQDFALATCEEHATFLRNFFAKNNSTRFFSSRNVVELTKNFNVLRKQANLVSAHFATQVQNGVKEAETMSNQMLDTLRKLIADTPWAINNNVTEVIERFTSKVRLYSNLENDNMELSGRLIALERTYSECEDDFDKSNQSTFFCLYYTSLMTSNNPIPEHFYLYDNAYNLHPLVMLSLPNYYHTTYAKEKASIIGYTGWAIGHEIGHSFVELSDRPRGLEFFSKTVEKCIQEQYSKTCSVFEENACEIVDRMFDDNGADIMGFLLSYQLLVEHYGDEIGTPIPRLGHITPEQLYFYSYAFQFCSGVPQGSQITHAHAARNVRVNVVAQHPGFKKAFGCPMESKMMQSANEPCVVYGEDAPETRRKFIFNTV